MGKCSCARFDVGYNIDEKKIRTLFLRAHPEVSEETQKEIDQRYWIENSEMNDMYVDWIQGFLKEEPLGKLFRVCDYSQRENLCFGDPEFNDEENRSLIIKLELKRDSSAEMWGYDADGAVNTCVMSLKDLNTQTNEVKQTLIHVLQKIGECSEFDSDKIDFYLYTELHIG